VDPAALVRLIAHRAPELDVGTLTLIQAALSGDLVPVDVLEKVLAVIDALQAKIDALAEAVDGQTLGQAA
jgi:hypothetical protein